MKFTKWTKVPVALLMAIGGFAVANHVTANADSTNLADANESTAQTDQAQSPKTQLVSGASQAGQSTASFKHGASSLQGQIVSNATSSMDDEFDDMFNNDVATAKSTANSLSAETSLADQSSHPNYQMSFASVSNGSEFGYNYYYASSGSATTSMATSFFNDVDDDIDTSFNWANSMATDMNNAEASMDSEFNAVNDAFNEDTFDTDPFNMDMDPFDDDITQMNLPSSTSATASSTTDQSSSVPASNTAPSSVASSTSDNSNDYNTFTIPKNNRAWNYVMAGTGGVPDYSDEDSNQPSNNYEPNDFDPFNDNVDGILNQISSLTDDLDDAMNSAFNDFDF